MRRPPLLPGDTYVASGRRLLRATWALQILGFLLWTAPLQAFGQEIHGEVRAKGVGIGVAGADVRLLGADSTLKGERQSDDHGGFVFKDLSPGSYSIRVDAPGFARQVEAQVLVRRSQVVAVTLWLDPQPITIPKLEVEARRRDFAFIHQQIGLRVQTLNPADLAVGAHLEKLKVGSYSLSDVLHKQAIPGLVIFQWPSGPCFQLRGAVDAHGIPVCAVVYLDGLRVDQNKVWSVEVENILPPVIVSVRVRVLPSRA